MLVDAAQNITYGDAEKIPITTIMRGVAEYEQFVGQARTLTSEPIALKADDLTAPYDPPGDGGARSGQRRSAHRQL